MVNSQIWNMKTNRKKTKASKVSADGTDSKSTGVGVSIAVGVAACCFGAYLLLTSSQRPLVSVTYVGSEDVSKKGFNLSCSQDYKEHPVFKGCTPMVVCSRIIRDNVALESEVDGLLNIAKRGFSHGGSNGGASILDLHSGALSKGDKFVNIFKYLDTGELQETFRDEDFALYSTVKSRVKQTITSEFGIDASQLYLTHPTFFSRITSAPAKTMHDEYWHKHIDKIQYGSFDYTSLLYLSDYGKDFTGGRFLFDDEKTLTVEPKKGRLSFFTSGSENPHHVEKVETGTRYAITISFTCDPEKSIQDPSLK